jgi:hypothetical protein
MKQIALLVSLVSAALWLGSALVRVPSIKASIDDLDKINELTEALQKQSRMSAWAACATGLSTLLQVLS